jgi:hypothetical protein
MALQPVEFENQILNFGDYGQSDPKIAVALFANDRLILDGFRAVWTFHLASTRLGWRFAPTAGSKPGGRRGKLDPQGIAFVQQLNTLCNQGFGNSRIAPAACANRSHFVFLISAERTPHQGN